MPPVEQEEIDVPLRLQPVVARPQGWRGRSGSLVAVFLVAFVVGALALGAVFDDGRPAVPIIAASVAGEATPRPTAHPTAGRPPLATPLPGRLVIGGQIPNERRLVYADGFEVLDLATGTLAPLALSLDYPAAVLPDDQIVCACVIRDVAASGDNSGSSLVYRRFDPTGIPLVEQELQSLAGVVGVQDMTEGFNATIGLDPDGRSAFILVAERRPPVWTVVLHVVDVETGTLRTSTPIGEVPVDLGAPAPTASPLPGGTQDGVYVWAGFVAVAPGGELAYVSVERSEVRNDNWTGQTLDWLVRIGDPTEVVPLDPGSALAPGTWCVSSPWFIDADLLAQVCTDPAEPQMPVFVRRIAADGTAVERVRLADPAFDGSWPMSVAVDRANRAVYVWHVQHHVLARVDLDEGTLATTAVSASMLPEAQSAGGNQGYIGGDPGLVIAPDGARLYAIGVAGVSGSSAGVPSGLWVFDAETLGLLDHWEPRAFLSSLAISRDGRFVYAAGAANVDVDGRDNRWPASVTVYDAATGEIQVIYGRVAKNSWLGFYYQP